MKCLVVHVDRLVLKGFRRQDHHAIAAGLRQELEHVFGDGDAVSRLKAMGDVPQLKVGGVYIEHGSKPRRVGEKVANGIGREIKK